jgi:ABC-type transport system involved in Fe-S cluster assembly fused permease/ATPase subunit
VVPSKFSSVITYMMKHTHRYLHNRGISFVLSSTVLHIFPTILEIAMVCGILASMNDVLMQEQVVD